MELTDSMISYSRVVMKGLISGASPPMRELRRLRTCNIIIDTHYELYIPNLT